MDYTKRLFEYFAEDETHRQVVIAPHAPPVERSAAGIDVAMKEILDDNDITDTLIGLRTHGESGALTSQPADVPDELADTFCLSIRGTGRFRVCSLTQRGTKAISITRIPFTTPSCSDLNVDEATVEKLLRALHDPQGGIVAVFGPTPDANSKAVYALLKRINDSERSVIVTLERELTQLMRHDNSIVVQRELGTDCTTMDDGIREALYLSPQILFVGDLLVTDRLPSLIRAVETQTSVILSVVASEKTSFLHIFKSVFGEQCDFLARRIRETLEVMPLTDGGLTADFSK
ncbi:MAG: Flp pilus assembly complex ATPase component TadA [Verrucomicrobia bacterium]|jgi:twitching motility protein PilT|nr:Flp pilus assembly complex ATPase component TadA [Verrucomicrobiota bacterium]